MCVSVCVCVCVVCIHGELLNMCEQYYCNVSVTMSVWIIIVTYFFSFAGI